MLGLVLEKVCINLRPWPAVSDIDGVTGMAKIKVIVAGERDPRQLARLRDRRCDKSEKEIVEQLSGHWREDHLFSLKQALKMFEIIQEQIAEYEREMLRRMTDMEREESRGQEPPALSNLRKGRQILADGDEPMRQALYRISGVDLATIDAIGVETIQVILSE